ncbi:MAG: hypothetical protein IKU48_01300 [Clostridia bacterium]|nr:hypothetical protein [Clostridia bacterium]
MTVKNIDLLKCVGAMKVLCEKENIGFLTSLSISKNVREIDNALENYLLQKQAVNDKYLVGGSNTQTIKSGCEEDYLREITELNDREVSIPIETIDAKMLANITFPPKFIEGISFMLDV